jgi:hypothetical protein
VGKKGDEGKPAAVAPPLTVAAPTGAIAKASNGQGSLGYEKCPNVQRRHLMSTPVFSTTYCFATSSQ